MVLPSHRSLKTVCVLQYVFVHLNPLLTGVMPDGPATLRTKLQIFVK